jgi:hypothetical protein
MGDRRAPSSCEDDPDLAVVREGFIAGRNDPDDIDGMIRLFRRFSNEFHESRDRYLGGGRRGNLRAQTPPPKNCTG